MFQLQLLHAYVRYQVLSLALFYFFVFGCFEMPNSIIMIMPYDCCYMMENPLFVL